MILNIVDKTIKPITTDFGDQESRIGFGGIGAAGKETFSLVLIASHVGGGLSAESGAGAFVGDRSFDATPKASTHLTCEFNKPIRMIGLEIYGVI